MTAQIPIAFSGSRIDNTASIYEMGTFDANASDTLLVSADLGLAMQK